VLPTVFAMVQARASGTSPSLDPRDIESSHYRPQVGGAAPA
jgi:hypothetical protein